MPPHARARRADAGGTGAIGFPQSGNGSADCLADFWRLGQGGGKAGSPPAAVFSLARERAMYESMLRSAVDAWFPAAGATYHRGDRHRCLTHARLNIRRAILEGKQAIEALGPLLLKWISDARVLHEAWDVLAAQGDTSPGPNGRRYDDLDDSEVWGLLKVMGQAIRKDTYRIGAEKVVQIPKDRSDPTRGMRPISLINIEDRVVQRAIVEGRQAGV